MDPSHIWPRISYQHYGPIVQKNWHVEARSEFSDNTALTVAREAIVLLKNSGHNLPIDKMMA